MSLESIRARVEAATEGRFSFIVEGMWRLHSGDCPYAGEDWDSDSKPDPNCVACQCIALAHHDIPLLLKVAEAAPTIDHIDQLIELMDSADRMMEAIGDPDNADVNVGVLAAKIGAVGYKAVSEHQVQDDLLKFRVALAELEAAE